VTSIDWSYTTATEAGMSAAAANKAIGLPGDRATFIGKVRG
jgi:hypothetical protein